MRQFLADNAPGLTAQKSPELGPVAGEEKGKGAKAGAKGAVAKEDQYSEEAAATIAGQAGPYAKKGEKTKIDEYNKKNAAGKAKMRQDDPEFQKVLERLQEQETRANIFRANVQAAQPGKAGQDQIVAHINAIRKELEAAGNSQAEQEAIIKTEIEGNADTNSFVQQYLEDGKIGGISISKPKASAENTSAAAGATPKAPAGKVKTKAEIDAENAKKDAASAARSAHPDHDGKKHGDIEYANFHKWEWQVDVAGGHWVDRGSTNSK
jgi:hypothetical protein